jgi:hypothetical protein
LIIGQPRSGTTALTHYLRGHDQVFIPDRKELNFFDQSEPSGRPLAWYERQFAPARPNQVAGEATPTYLFTPEAPARMAALVPKARLIALLRNPVERAYSHYWLCRLLQYEHREFADAVRDELAGRVTPGLEYLAYGRYVEQLDRLFEHYSRSALLVLLFDDLRTDAPTAFAATCRHIGVDDTIRPPIVGERVNAAQRPRSIRLWRVLERWRNSKRPGFVLARFISALNVVDVKPPPVDPSVREVLLDHYGPSVDALAAWLGRDLSAWKA